MLLRRGVHTRVARAALGLTSVPPITEYARTRTTGAPAGGGPAGSSFKSLPPISAKPLSSTWTPSGTMMSEPPIREKTRISVSAPSTIALVKSRSAPPITLTTVQREPMRQRPG